MRNLAPLIVASLLLSSCAHKFFTPPNVYICGRLAFGGGGTCYQTLTENAYPMTETEFQKMLPMVYMPPESWAEIHKFIKRVCLKEGDCSVKWK